MNRLVLIDGHAIIHRAYWALPPLTSSQGQQVNAVYGFISMLFRVIDDLKPTYLAVAFDLPTPTFRHEAYIGYQAKRPAMEEEMKGQIDLVHEAVSAAGIPIYTAPGFEADDVIGTLAKQAVQSKRVKEYKTLSKKKTPALKLSSSSTLVDEVIIVTGDRDIMQLVRDRDRVRVYAPVRGLSEAKLYKEKDVKEYIGVAPQKIIDYKALVGDQSDNYPGVPGVGPKTAIELLEKYKDLDGVYKALGLPAQVGTRHWGLGENVAEKLREGHESAVLSKKLATIITDAPVTFSSKNARLTDLSKNEKFIAKLREFGFRSLVKRLTGEAESPRIQSKPKPTYAGRSKKNNGQMGLL